MDGLHDGTRIGFKAGYRAGFDDGLSTGLSIGYTKGYEDKSYNLPFSPPKVSEIKPLLREPIVPRVPEHIPVIPKTPLYETKPIYSSCRINDVHFEEPLKNSYELKPEPNWSNYKINDRWNKKLW